MLRSIFLSAVLVLAGLGLFAAEPSMADARPRIQYRHGYNFTPNWYTMPYSSYYGQGAHDFYPHWHNTSTPLGTFSWYGNGPHDYVPHAHTQTPYSYRGYSYTPWSYTESYYPPYPYYYGPW